MRKAHDVDRRNGRPGSKTLILFWSSCPALFVLPSLFFFFFGSRVLVPARSGSCLVVARRPLCGT